MIEINGHKIGWNHEPFFIADIGANHDGDLDRAKRFVPLVARAGAHAIKYQSFNAPTIVSQRGFQELGRLGHQATWSKDVYTTYEEAAIAESWVPILAETCRDYGVAFMTTAYSKEIADAVDPYVAAHKIGSGDITWHELIRHVHAKGKPVFLATGASTSEEVDAALKCVPWDDADPPRTVLLQTNTNYSGDPENVRYLNLRVLNRWLEKVGPPVGLSDHTPGYLGVCVAIGAGACVFEKHFTDDRNREGPDHSFAMEPQDWKDMVEAANYAWAALGNGVKKVEANEIETRIIQRRALRWTRNLPRNHMTVSEDFIPTRPCPEGALEPSTVDGLIGRVLQKDVEADTLVRPEDF